MMRRVTICQYEAVRRALRAGMRHSEIARELDLSVWTIAWIADTREQISAPLCEEDLPEPAAQARVERAPLENGRWLER